MGLVHRVAACTAALLLGAAGFLLTGERAVPAAGATIAYPDLQVQVPTLEISIGTSGTTRSLQFSHVTWDAGAGPLEIRPSYNPQTGIAQGSQALYSSDANGNLTFQGTVPIVKPMIFDPPSDYRFPLAQFGLYSVASDGGVGALVAPSPKVDFCITADTFVGGVPNTPAQTRYPAGNCDSPSGTLGLDVGWGDKYDLTDAGENIDLTGVPDGTYWLRATVDPFHYLVESDTGNNVTDTELAISGGQVTVLSQVMPDSTPPTLTVTAPASVSGSVTLTATASGPNPVTSLQFLLDGAALGPVLTSAPYSFAWNANGTPPGAHIISAQAVDSKGFYGTAPAVAVTVPQTIGTFTIDAVTQVTGRDAITTWPFSTSSPNDLVLALVGSDGGAGQTVAVSGGGLSWSLLRRSNGQLGDSEIWKAMATSVLSGATVTSTQSSGGYDQSLTVLAVQGASGTGASAAAGAGSGAPSVTLTTTAAGSWVLAAGNDWDSATARTVASGQQLISQDLDLSSGDTFWAQMQSATAGAAGQSVTMSDTAPTGDRWNLAAVELLSGSPPPPPPPDTTPPTVSITNPVAGQTVSGTVPVAAAGSDNVAVASVQVLLDGKPLGAPLTSAPYALSWDTTQVANGSHQLGATATDTSGNVGTAGTVTVTVTNPPPPMSCFVLDARVSVDGNGSVTTPTFHTAQAGELLLAFAASDGPASAAQSLTISGAGLTWTLVERSNSQAGDSEIWKATAASVLTSATVTSEPAHGGFDQSLTVIALQGTSGTGAAAAGGAADGAPSLSLATTGVNSLVYGVGNDWDSATARTVGSNQVLLDQTLDTATGDTFWAQNTTVQAGPAGSVVALNDTAPTTDHWNLAAVEVLGAAS